MQKVLLNNTDLKLSLISYGTGNFGDKITKQQAFEFLDAYISAGGNFIDTANVYCRWVPGLTNSSEQIIGQWLKDRNAYKEVVIATKGGHYDFKQPDVSRMHQSGVVKDLEESLQTLGLSTIDFYWLHRDNPQMPIEQIVDIMEGLVRSGKIRYYGASNFTLDRMVKATAYAKKQGVQGFSAISNQWSLAKVNPVELSGADGTMVYTDQAYQMWHEETQMPLIPYSAGAKGFFEKLQQLGGISQEDIERGYISGISNSLNKSYCNRENIRIYDDLCKRSKQTGQSVFALSIEWLLQHPFQVFPILSVTKKEQMQQLALIMQ